MIAAQNSSPLELVIPAEGERPPALGFAKLFHSVEGLHRRLAEFSIDDVARAEDTVNTLIRRLAMLQNRLERIADLKDRLAEVSAAVEQTASAERESIRAAAAHTPGVQGIIDAEKVIRLHRFLSAASVLAQSHPLDVVLNRLPSAAPPAAPYSGATQSDGEAPAAVLASDVQPPSSGLLPPEGEPETSPPPTPSTGAEKFVAVLPGGIDAAWLAADSNITSYPIPDKSTEHLDELPADECRESETPPPVAMRDDAELPAVDNHASRFAGDMTAADAPGAILLPVAISAAQKPLSETKSNPPAENGLPPPEAVFDKRLLDDLIQNYGELIPYQGPQAPAVASASAAREEESRPSFSLPAIYEAAEPGERSDPLADPALPPEPNFVLAERAPIAEFAPAPDARPRTRSVPVSADIDRQLKKIIADYGQYDLYQRQSSSNLKRSGIVAFIILGLVLFGVYFLKGPKPSVSGQAGSSYPSVSTTERSAEEAGGHTVTQP